MCSGKRLGDSVKGSCDDEATNGEDVSEGCK